MEVFKRYITVFIIAILVLSGVSYPVGSEVIPIKQLKEAEIIILGEPDNGPVFDRVNRLERLLYGKELEGSLVDRVNRLVSFVLPSSGKPSMVLLLNALEWTITNNISYGPVKERLESIEKLTFGQIKTGSIVERLSGLVNLSLPDGKIPTRIVTIPAGTKIRIKLLNKISSRESQIGEIIKFKVVQNVKVNDILVIPSGMPGSMKVVNVSRAGQLGKDGHVELKYLNVLAIDGNEIPFKIPEKVFRDYHSRELAIAASLLSYLVFEHPAGLIAGYFVRGQEEVIDAGNELYVETTEDVKVYGLQLYH
ncbi:hypothetical protein [Halothermothrix orenii]|uniref:Uncharacterized protein n=1 Tax=Halothermothrix orenii (strain H 168 / OCM 544 / DSM 9562) TaxID=373903 RepID=B8CYX4_HALOH|nr:hypothetical protein [Halothermothrix orenii]ACL70493.1 hypothetical protein Hore_17440 [Halothermothrix orenii H 168]